MGDALLTVDLGDTPLVRSVFAGEDFNCAILEDRRVKCWGNNAAMQLGNGSTDVSGDSPLQLGQNLPYTDLGPGFAAKTLALGASHACALSTDNAIKCWGNNGDGQLGIGSNESHGAPITTMGAGLPKVDLGGSQRALGIAVGAQHSCATRDDGKVSCWGANGFGQLGIGNQQSRGAISSEMGEQLTSTLLD
jgi:E3 ubiquitin-protein ligase HERC3